MFRGRISIEEIMNLPNRVYMGLLNMKYRESLDNEKEDKSNDKNPKQSKNNIQSQLMEEELEDIILGGI